MRRNYLLYSFENASMRLGCALVALGVTASVCLAGLVAEATHESETERIWLPRQWAFRLDPGDVGQDERWFEPAVAEKAGWDRIQVTAPWNAQLISDDPEDPSMIQYHGVAWYSTAFQLPCTATGQRLWLEFDAVAGHVWVYLNGEAVAAYPVESSETSETSEARIAALRFDVTDHVQAEDNHLAVRIEAASGDGGITRPVALRCGGPNLVSNGDFADDLADWDLRVPDDEGLARRWTTVPGRYANEEALRVELQSATPMTLSQHVAHPVRAGQAYRVWLRYQQQLEEAGEAHPIQLEVQAEAGGDGQAAGLRWESDPHSTEGWREWRTVVRAQNDAAGLRVNLTFARQGVYILDEVFIESVVTDEADREEAGR